MQSGRRDERLRRHLRQPDPSVPAGGPLVALDQGVLRPFIKQWITQTWSHAAGLEFTDWGDCPIDAATGFHKDSQLANTIVIQFKDGDAARVSAVRARRRPWFSTTGSG